MQRYTLTYTPAVDRILPSPTHLHVKIKNTSAIPLRAAYLHGPYTLHVAAYPSTFNPNKKFVTHKRDGEPEFEPNLKAGGSWYAKLTIPADIRESGDREANDQQGTHATQSATWIIEIASQILFSNNASVHYELAIAREERTLDVGFAALAGKGYGEPADVQDYIRTELEGRRRGLPKGVYSKAVRLLVEDTAALWNKPPLPQWRVSYTQPRKPPGTLGRSLHNMHNEQSAPASHKQNPTKIHLVILTHGLHSNLGADCLYLKESIDVAAKQAREDVQKRKDKARREREHKKQENQKSSEKTKTDKKLHEDTNEDNELDDEDEDEEQVIVRGFSGNSVRTERGIQYLGKRLAKFVLTMTYPDQPYLPQSKSTSRTFTGSFSPKSSSHYGSHAEDGSHKEYQVGDLPYTFSKISFIGHSLGGLIQTYAIAYIHKHSPNFFTKIKPTNFVCMASPLLGLSNENPMYVKFALDFGLVGRTGQDLGLTWRAPIMVRSGWSAMISGFGGGSKDDKPREEDPRSKPLLRILPTGPAHQVLKMFRNRTVYANVVNDGIVPLRTSCLLFLDWRGLGRVENARRENGLLGTMAAFGWAELTGQNTVSHKPSSSLGKDNSEEYSEEEDSTTPVKDKHQRTGRDVPQPSQNATNEDNPDEPAEPEPHQFLDQMHPVVPESPASSVGDHHHEAASEHTTNPLADLFNFFRAGTVANSSHHKSPRKERAYRRAQTIKQDASEGDDQKGEAAHRKPPVASRGDSMLEEDGPAGPPPKTSIFEAAGDILHPPIPTQEWLMDPSSRSRTIFHDRVYQPEDIPNPPPKRSFLGRSHSSDSTNFRSGRLSSDLSRHDGSVDASGMKVEEKIARAYHHDLAWRKVLVRLEPDAHNNMIVRRMFANAYGWDVVKHLCDTHFADTAAKRTRDDDETGEDRARGDNESVGEEGDVVHGQHDGKTHAGGDSGKGSGKKTNRSRSELAEISDELASLNTSISATADMSSSTSQPQRQGSVASTFSRDGSITASGDWDDALFEGSVDGDDSDDERPSRPFEAWQRFWSPGGGGGGPRTERRRSAGDGRAPRLELRTRDVDRYRGGGGGDGGSGTWTAGPRVADAITQSPRDMASPQAFPQPHLPKPRPRPWEATSSAQSAAPAADMPRGRIMPGPAPSRVGPKTSVEQGMDESASDRSEGSGITEGVARAADDGAGR